jgi:hypothetical protein
MLENGFVPLAPRRLQRTSDSPYAAIGIAAADQDGDGAQLPHPPQVPQQQQVPQPPHEPEVQQVPESPERSARAESETGETDAACVRAAAIRFAAAACARALRYAVDRNPRLVARFVDEALRAAGSPHNAVVRVAPAVTAVGAELKEHDFVADPSLATGDVFIDCAAGTLGATLDERAEILVRAAAS